MIELNIEHYCENCSDFEPKVIKIAYGNDTHTHTHTTVACENLEKCRNLVSYLTTKILEERYCCCDEKLIRDIYKKVGLTDEIQK